MAYRTMAMTVLTVMGVLWSSVSSVQGGGSLSFELHATGSTRVVLSEQPLVIHARLAAEVAPSRTGTEVAVRRLVAGSGAPSYAAVRLRGSETLAIVLPPAKAVGWTLTSPSVATVDGALRSTVPVVARLGLGGMDPLPFVALPRPDEGLVVQTRSDGTLAIRGALYFQALHRAGSGWSLDLDRPRHLEPYLADLPAALSLAAPPVGRGTVPFRGFAGTAASALVAIFGPDVKTVVADLRCEDPALTWTAAEASGGLALTGRLAKPCRVTLKGAPCLTVTTLQRSLVVDRSTGAITADGGEIVLSDVQIKTTLFTLKVPSWTVAWRLNGLAASIAAVTDIVPGPGDDMSLLGVGGR